MEEGLLPPFPEAPEMIMNEPAGGWVEPVLGAVGRGGWEGGPSVIGVERGHLGLSTRAVNRWLTIPGFCS